MNYYEARQRSDKSGWAWTVMNDGVIRTTGGCATAGEPHQHETREYAERCFYDHEVANLRATNLSADTQHRCEYPGCEAWTQAGLSGQHLGTALLCDVHRNPDGWRSARPFLPNLSIASSY